MKPSRLLPATLACLLTAGLLGQTPLRAADDDQAAHKAAAEAVLKAMHMETVFGATTERVMTSVDRLTDGTARQIKDKAEATDFQTRMHAQSREMLKKQFNWEAIQPEFVQSYAATFTTPELKELAAFYDSPVGQKLVAKQPELSDRIGKISQEKMQQILPQIIGMVRAESAKIQGPGANAPGGPGGLPIPPAPGTGPGQFPVPPAPPAGFGKSPMLPAPPAGFVPPAPPPAMLPPVPPAPPAAPSSTPAVNPAPKGTP